MTALEIPDPSLVVLIGVSLVATLLAARSFSTREFSMKTPEGS